MSATATPTPQPVRRPILIAILAILVAIYGLVVAIGGLLIFFNYSIFQNIVPPGLGQGNIILGIGVAIVGLIIIGIAVGLWHLRMWAWAIAFLVTLGSLIYAIIYGGSPYYGFDTFEGIFSLLVLIYLLVVVGKFREAGKQRSMAAQQAHQ